MATRAFYSLPTVCQYATLYSLLVFCQCVHCCLLQSATCLLVTHNVPYVGSVPLCPLLFSTLCPLSVSTSQCTVCWFCVAVASFVFYNLSTVCQYLTVYRRLFLCHYVHLSLLQSVNCLSVPHNVPSDCSVTLCPLQSSKVSPFSISTSHCYVCRFSAIMAFSAFYTLPNVCQYLTLYHLLVLCHYVHCCLLHCAKCMSVPHNVPSFGCVLLCQIVFYSPSTDLKYLTIYRLLILCHCALFWFLQSVHYLSVPHNVPSVSSISLCSILSSTACLLSISITYFTFCWFCVTVPISLFYSMSTVPQYLII